MTAANPIRVLVVDDDFAVASVHQGYVESIPGLEVVGVAHRGEEAVRAAGALLPDLVLLDVYLPDMSGIEVLRRLRTFEHPQPDVIMITAAREGQTVHHAMTSGVIDYLVKPFSLAVFRERLGAYQLHRAELMRRNGDAGLQQVDVDRMLAARARAGGGPSGSPLPKGLSPRTLESVARILRNNPAADLSAGEVAGQCGLARVSARRYLEHLERSGLAAVHPRYGTAGRPENGYRWVG